MNHDFISASPNKGRSPLSPPPPRNVGGVTARVSGPKAEVDAGSDGGQMLLLRAWEGIYPWLPLRWDAEFMLHQAATVLEVGRMSRPVASGAG